MSMRSALVAFALAAAIGGAFAAPPEPSPVTPQLVEAAKKEGKVVFYTAIDLKVAEGIGKLFEAAYPGVAVQVERTGSERIFQRLQQERSSNIFAADVIDGSDQSMFITLKSLSMLEPYVPADVAQWPGDQRDPDGYYASVRFTLMPITYNSKLIKPEDAPKSFADLLDPKFAGKMVKAHPGYSGGIVTSTFQVTRDLGWDYMRKLSAQRVMQVQSATEPAKKLSLGERAIAVDGLEYVAILEKEKGAPVEIVYAAEGTPFIPGCTGIANRAPHPNAAKLFMNFLFSQPAQQYLSDVAGLRSFHPGVKEKPSHKPLGEIKLMKSDPDAQEKETEALKRKYAEYFRV